MVTRGTTGTLDRSDPEALHFLRRRVMSYGLVVGTLGAVAVLIRLAYGASYDHVRFLSDPSTVAHILAALVFFVVVAACRLGPLRWGYLVFVEAMGILVGSLCYIWMGYQIPLAATPEMITVSVLSLGFYARAIYVPSPPRRTALLGLILLVPLAYMTYRSYLERLPNLPAMLRMIDVTTARFGIVEPTTIDREAISSAVEVSIWWLFTVVVGTLASRVIYGLRRQVRDIKKLGQYTLVEKLGEGGMGLVYRAQHAMLRRPTAVKLLPAERTGDRALARFEREVQLTASLTHPNTVTIFDYGRTPEDVFYYAMELLEGATLEDVVRADGPQPAARVVHILAQAASALVEAHGVGLIHRDIKPANIMLTHQGGVPDTAKLLDFGLVKELDRNASASLSQVNVIAGTPHYMSPEAISSPQDLDGRSDLYGLAAVGYFLLTGENVFSSANVVEVCAHHLHTVPELPSTRTDNPIPKELEALLMECLAKKRSERPASATVLRDRLRGLALTWSEDEAAVWWDDFGEAIAAARKTETRSPSGHTVVVDFEQR
ncbi:MAG: serine/threonine-protein kinase [Myxococcota bacterium]